MSGVNSLRDELAREAKDWRHNAYTRVMLAQMHDRLSTTPSQVLDAATVERCAQIVRECGPQNPESDWTEHARIRAHMRDRILSEFALATDPHQHGGKGA